jgi:hypothetical protein
MVPERLVEPLICDKRWACRKSIHNPENYRMCRGAGPTGNTWNLKAIKPREFDARLEPRCNSTLRKRIRDSGPLMAALIRGRLRMHDRVAQLDQHAKVLKRR